MRTPPLFRFLILFFLTQARFPPAPYFFFDACSFFRCDDISSPPYIFFPNFTLHPHGLFPWTGLYASSRLGVPSRTTWPPLRSNCSQIMVLIDGVSPPFPLFLSPVLPTYNFFRPRPPDRDFFSLRAIGPLFTATPPVCTPCLMVVDAHFSPFAFVFRQFPLCLFSPLPMAPTWTALVFSHTKSSLYRGFSPTSCCRRPPWFPPPNAGGIYSTSASPRSSLVRWLFLLFLFVSCS